MSALAVHPTVLSTGRPLAWHSRFEITRGAGLPGGETGTQTPGFLLLTGATHFVFLEGFAGQNWIGNALLAAL